MCSYRVCSLIFFDGGTMEVGEKYKNVLYLWILGPVLFYHFMLVQLYIHISTFQYASLTPQKLPPPTPSPYKPSVLRKNIVHLYI